MLYDCHFLAGPRLYFKNSEKLVSIRKGANNLPENLWNQPVTLVRSTVPLDVQEYFSISLCRYQRRPKFMKSGNIDLINQNKRPSAGTGTVKQVG